MTAKYCIRCMEPLKEGENACAGCGHEGTYEAPLHHLGPGTILQEKYLVGAALGEGGFGITYIGRDLTLDMRIAVKEYYPNGLSTRNHNDSNMVTLTQTSHQGDFEKEMSRFLNEARILAKFAGEPGVVGVRDFFRANGTAYIVMEHLDGKTLKDYEAQRGPIPAAEFFDMVKPILQTLQGIHSQGLIHRDISPDNIMLLKSGSLKLLDFGAAREAVEDKSLSVMLKPGYAPEEQYRTKGKQGPWTDIYALCATIYKCITGVTPEESIQRVLDDDLKAPSKLGADISPRQEAALMRGLSVRAADRFQSVDDLLSALSATSEDDIKTVYIAHGQESGSTSTNGQKDTEPQEKEDLLPQRGETVKKSRPASEPDGKMKAPRQRPGWLKWAGLIAVAVLAVGVGVAAFRSPGSSGPQTIEPDSAVENTVSDVFKSFDLTQSGEYPLDISDGYAFHESYLAKELGNGLVSIVDPETLQAGDTTYSKVEVLGDGLLLATVAQDLDRITADSYNDKEILQSDGSVILEQCFHAELLNERYLCTYYIDSPSEVPGPFTFTDGAGSSHSGHAAIYDMTNGCFIPGIQLNEGEKVWAFGNALCIYTNNQTTFYDSTGCEARTLEGVPRFSGATVIMHVEGFDCVYDDSFALLYRSSLLRPIDGDNKYLQEKVDGGYRVIDHNGSVIIDRIFQGVSSANDNVICYAEKKKYGLVRTDGVELYPPSCQFPFSYAGYGFFSAKNRKDYVIVCADGRIISGLDSSAGQLVVDQKSTTGRKVFVIKEGAYSVAASGYVQPLTTGLAAIRGENGFGLLDTISGQQLLPCQYDVIRYAAGQVYAQQNSLDGFKCTAYTLTVNCGKM